jgi:hypothetical protein
MCSPQASRKPVRLASPVIALSALAAPNSHPMPNASRVIDKAEPRLQRNLLFCKVDERLFQS